MTDEQNKQIRELQIARIKAVHEESVIRESVFLPITLDICGVKCKQLTLQMYMYLDFAQNPLITGKDAQPNDVIGCLWVCSSDFKECDKEAFEAFIKKNEKIDIQKAYEDLNEYLFNSLMDLNNGRKEKNNSPMEKKNDAPYYSWVSVYVDTLANQYGWTRDYIFSLPIGEILQYMRLIEERLNVGQKVTFGNALSDKATGDLLKYLGDMAKGEGKILVEK